MAAGPLTLYQHVGESLADGSLDLDSDTLKVALFTSSHTPSASTHEAFSGLTGEVSNGNGYTSGGATLANVTLSRTGGTAKLDADDVVWTASGGSIVARYAVIYSQTADKVIGYFLLDDTPADVTVTDGNTLTIAWHASNGILTIAV